MERLVRAAVGHRHYRGRISSGFAWAPWQRLRGPRDLPTVDADLLAAAAELIDDARHSSGAAAQHSAAIACLAAGNARRARELLRAIPPAARYASTWSDFAAAIYAVADDNGLPAELLLDGLVAADAALALDPRMHEAQFNRAMVVEGMGLRALATGEWKRYLELDHATQWAVEARDHLRALEEPSPLFGDELQRRYASIAADPAAAPALATRFPQEVRTWGETEILGRWAEAELKHDKAAAAHLEVARKFGEVVSARHDFLLAHAVAAIDQSSPSSRRTLAEGHLAFRAAQQAFLKMRTAEAEKTFGIAAGLLERGGSPVALLARYFAANTEYEQGRIDEAAVDLERLRASAPEEFRSYRAQLNWELGLCRSARGRYGEALSLFTESLRVFEALGENGNASAMRGIIASVLDLIGDSAQAWALRASSLRELGKGTSARLQASLGSLATLAILRNDLSSAASILRLELETARLARNDVFIADALLRRAMVLRRMGKGTAANADLAEARQVVHAISDSGYRSQYEARLLWVEGVLTPSPREAIDYLSRAVDYHRTAGRSALLPAVLLDRANAFRAAGMTQRATADLESAMTELDLRRESLPAGDRRWGVFHVAEEIVSAAIAMALEERDVARAFAYSERARARTLLDAWAERAPDGRNDSLPATVIEYHAAPASLHIFVASSTGVRVVDVTIDRAALTAQVSALSQAISAGDDKESRAVAERLHRLLIDPVAGWLRRGEKLVIVPDGYVSAVPFAALVRSDRRFLIEEHPLVIAPSAASYAVLEEHSTPAAGPLLMVVSASSGGRLPAADVEAAALQRLYADVTLLEGRRATPEQVIRDAPRAPRIHFTGHAIAAETTPDQTAIVLSDGAEGERKLDVRQIASMRLELSPVVVLAACSTARGRVSPLEGTRSVAFSFLRAGARSVVATLWPIDDREAAVFFTRVHEHLARGETAADAVRAAQIQSIQQNVPQAMWAAVQDIGS